jgi:UPF0755 protein
MLAAILLGAVTTHLHITFFVPVSREPAPAVVVVVPRGMSFKAVAVRLHEAGVIRDVDNFIFAARFKRAAKRIKAGEYELSANMAVVDILNMLIDGRVMSPRLTIPEGYNITGVAMALTEAGFISDPDEFIKRAHDRTLAAELGFKSGSLEGLLFPDTYAFTKDMPVDEMISMMTARFRAVYYKDFDKMARARGMSLNKVITLASIIEKETGAGEERPLISAVFHNRLRTGVRLQSDPTVIYGIKDFDGNLTKKHLQTRTPYNTYRFHGLPPGPIANPGAASIEAAINPASEGYLYFVSRGDGTHYFSKSLREHNNAVNRFQR